MEGASPEQNYCLRLPFPFDIFIVPSFRIVNLLRRLYNTAVERRYLKAEEENVLPPGSSTLYLPSNTRCLGPLCLSALPL